MYKSNKLFGLNILIANFESFLWFGLIALLLYPIWVNKYFLTLDGPCHLYNASVLRDLWSNINTPFFLRFYDINHQIDPNWFSHIILAFLMMFLSPQLSEKIFLSSYVISFLLFFRWLILYINKENKFLAYIPFLFVYNHVFQMGFYNFSFSLLWMILTWLFFLKYIYKWPAYMFIPIGALILLLTYITHPAGYLITCATLLLLIFLKVLEEYSSFTDFLKALFGQFILVFAAMLPSLILLGYFISRRASYGSTPSSETFISLGNNIIQLTGIVDLVSAESPFAKITFWLIVAALILAVLFKTLSLRFNRFDAFLILTIFLTYFYFKAPGSIGGVGTVYERLQIMPFVVLPFWLASVSYPKWIVKVIGLSCIAIVICLMAIRIPVHKECSEAVSEYMSTEKYIDSASTVLPLSYAHNGKMPNGELIADRTWIFFHAGDYLGTQKPLIMMGNYEANTGFFPLLWKPNVNPFSHLCENDGIENMPPSVNMGKFENDSHEKVDYVILLCLDSQFISHANTVDLFNQLKRDYRKIYTSEYGRAVLYRRNNY